MHITYISKRYEWKSRVEESQLSKDVSSGILDLSAPSGSKLIQKQRRPRNLGVYDNKAKRSQSQSTTHHHDHSNKDIEGISL
ncbi:hypothetical protein ANCCEY_01821 [Ancylostoma ceylanicum]|uniref:Uncharacterized protein n=1 Tax=Ancylostoma ceylanicum TaxID=53326 RepID=A0A0D6M6F7_9BILA|nr:hypothetical protein ANCCEY_01821 [Ancylostoma ceylanicum]